MAKTADFVWMDGQVVPWADAKIHVSADAVLRAVKGCDTVFHLGALTSIPHALHHPQQVVAANVNGTLNVLVACRDAGVQRQPRPPLASRRRKSGRPRVSARRWPASAYPGRAGRDSAARVRG